MRRDGIGASASKGTFSLPPLRRADRSTFFWIFPDGVRGKSSTKRSSSGHFCRASPGELEALSHRGKVEGRHARHGPDDGGAVLAVACIGRGDDGHLGNPGDRSQDVLHFGGRHVLATPDDDVLLAVGDRQVAVRVDDADVARVVPPVGVDGVSGQVGIGVARKELGPREWISPGRPTPTGRPSASEANGVPSPR